GKMVLDPTQQTVDVIATIFRSPLDADNIRLHNRFLRLRVVVFRRLLPTKLAPSREGESERLMYAGKTSSETIRAGQRFASDLAGTFASKPAESAQHAGKPAIKVDRSASNRANIGSRKSINTDASEPIL